MQTDVSWWLSETVLNTCEELFCAVNLGIPGKKSSDAGEPVKRARFTGCIRL
jgi:hypothetical protein